jgi:hypothetical protein
MLFLFRSSPARRLPLASFSDATNAVLLSLRTHDIVVCHPTSLISHAALLLGPCAIRSATIRCFGALGPPSPNQKSHQAHLFFRKTSNEHYTRYSARPRRIAHAVSSRTVYPGETHRAPHNRHSAGNSYLYLLHPTLSIYLDIVQQYRAIVCIANLLPMLAG